VKLSVWMTLVLLGWILYLFAAPSTAQNNSTSPRAISVDLTAAFPTPLRPGVQGTLTLKIKNVLQPRPPIQLVAIATWIGADGQTYTTQSNTITIQVVQPVTVSQIDLPLPSNLSISGNTVTLPLQPNVTLNEGQEYQQQIPVVVR